MRLNGISLALVFVLALPALESRQSDTQTGSVEFVARVTPTGGRPEPARQVTFYLLRKSFAEIQKEAEQADPRPELDTFIEGLEVSKELKAWMKEHRAVELSGAEFTRQLKADDVLAVPEFYDAYLEHNSGGATMDFPKPKYRQEDAQRNPQKYQRQLDEYRRRVRHYLERTPQSLEGIEARLDAINPAPRWMHEQGEHRQRTRRSTLKLAHAQYLAAQTDTDLEGRGVLSGIPPGEYWLSTLATEAVAGDTRLRWDTAVTVRPGRVTHVELSNLNALEPPRAAP